MTSHSLRFLVVVVKIAPSVTLSRESVKKFYQKRHVGQGKLPGVSQSYVLMCSIAIQIQRNSAWSFLCFFFDERGIAKGVVNKHFKGKLFSKFWIPSA